MSSANSHPTSGVTIIGEREERHEDLRWGTQNTKLAAALLCLGFHLSKEQPFTALVSGVRVKAVTIWFSPVIYHDTEGEPYEKPLLTRDVEGMWGERNKKFPEIFWMRSALEARDYLIREVIHGGAHPMSGERITKSMHRTDRTEDAVVAYSCGAALHGFRDHWFYFEPKAALRIQLAHVVGGEWRECWALHAVRQQGVLMDAINGKNRQATSAKVAGNFGVAYIPELMSPEEKNAHLRMIDLGK